MYQNSFNLTGKENKLHHIMSEGDKKPLAPNRNFSPRLTDVNKSIISNA